MGVLNFYKELGDVWRGVKFLEKVLYNTWMRSEGTNSVCEWKAETEDSGGPCGGTTPPPPYFTEPNLIYVLCTS